MSLFFLSETSDIGTQFGLIPTEESGEYSSKFLGVSVDGKFTIEDEWSDANGTIWIISSEWEGQAGV